MPIAILHFSVFLVLLVLHSANGGGAIPTRVGIVGGGIGAGATAYYLKKLMRGGVDITVFEQNDYLGGRLKHITFEGIIEEVGGDAFSNVNEYVVEIANDLGLQFDDGGSDGNGLVGLWDGSTWYEVKYRPYVSDAKIYALIETMKLDLWLNYKERGASKTFNTIEEFLSYGRLNKWASVSSESIVSDWGIDETLVWKTWDPLSRVIFDQGLQCNGFAGCTSLLSAVTPSFTVLGGNSLLVEKTLKSSQAHINLNTQVKEISKSNGKYLISGIQSTTKQPINGTFDYVVIAAPIEHTNIKFNVSLPKITPRDYHHWYVVFVSAKGLNPSHFGVNPVPDTVLTTSNCSTCGFTIVSVRDELTDGYKIYKIFTNYNMTGELDSMFVSIRNTYVHYWSYTFPDLAPVSQYQPIMLDTGMFYLNTIESVAVAMGASAPAGRNIALLISQASKNSG